MLDLARGSEIVLPHKHHAVPFPFEPRESFAVLLSNSFLRHWSWYRSWRRGCRLNYRWDTDVRKDESWPGVGVRDVQGLLNVFQDLIAASIEREDEELAVHAIEISGRWRPVNRRTRDAPAQRT